MNMCLPWSSVCSSPPPRPRRWRSDPRCFLSFSDRPEEIYTETDHVFELLMGVQLKADHERGEAALEAIFDKKVAAEIAEEERLRPTADAVMGNSNKSGGAAKSKGKQPGLPRAGLKGLAKKGGGGRATNTMTTKTFTKRPYKYTTPSEDALVRILGNGEGKEQREMKGLKEDDVMLLLTACIGRHAAIPLILQFFASPDRLMSLATEGNIENFCDESHQITDNNNNSCNTHAARDLLESILFQGGPYGCPHLAGHTEENDLASDFGGGGGAAERGGGLLAFAAVGIPAIGAVVSEKGGRSGGGGSSMRKDGKGGTKKPGANKGQGGGDGSSLHDDPTVHLKNDRKIFRCRGGLLTEELRRFPMPTMEPLLRMCRQCFKLSAGDYDNNFVGLFLYILGLGLKVERFAIRVWEDDEDFKEDAEGRRKGPLPSNRNRGHAHRKVHAGARTLYKKWVDDLRNFFEVDAAALLRNWISQAEQHRSTIREEQRLLIFHAYHALIFLNGTKVAGGTKDIEFKDGVRYTKGMPTEHVRSFTRSAAFVTSVYAPLGKQERGDGSAASFVKGVPIYDVMEAVQRCRQHLVNWSSDVEPMVREKLLEQVYQVAMDKVSGLDQTDILRNPIPGHISWNEASEPDLLCERVVETPHDFPCSTTWMEHVSFPGARFITLTFLAQCEWAPDTEVQLFADHTCSNELLKLDWHALPGTKAIMPKKLTGDSFWIRVKSGNATDGHHQDKWGMAVTCQAPVCRESATQLHAALRGKQPNLTLKDCMRALQECMNVLEDATSFLKARRHDTESKVARGGVGEGDDEEDSSGAVLGVFDNAGHKASVNLQTTEVMLDGLASQPVDKKIRDMAQFRNRMVRGKKTKDEYDMAPCMSLERTQYRVKAEIQGPAGLTHTIESWYRQPSMTRSQLFFASSALELVEGSSSSSSSSLSGGGDRGGGDDGGGCGGGGGSRVNRDGPWNLSGLDMIQGWNVPVQRQGRLEYRGRHYVIAHGMTRVVDDPPVCPQHANHARSNGGGSSSNNTYDDGVPCDETCPCCSYFHWRYREEGGVESCEACEVRRLTLRVCCVPCIVRASF